MKKLLKITLALFIITTLVACGSKSESNTSTLSVAATLEPHATILEEAKKILKDKYDIDLKIEVLDNYYIFNKSLDNGEIDANYFQHVPFFDEEVKTKGYDIVNVGGVHIEPFGFYSQTIKNINDLKDKSTIIISNSVADHGRILSILDKAGIITLADGINKQTATVKDIKKNSKNLKFVEVNPELLATSYDNNSGDLIAINGNYAIQAGLNPTKDALILETADEDNPYVNIVAVKKGHENDKNIKSLLEVLQSEEIQNFIKEKYSDGSVIPVTK